MSNEDYVSVVDAAKKVRTALRQAFPKNKFSVTSHCDIWITWTDDEPGVEQVKDALLRAGCAETVKTWNDAQYLKAHGHSFWFDRYSVAERAAEAQTRELRQQEWAAQRQREDDAVRAARAAKRTVAREGVSPPILRTDAEHDQAAHDAFEKLRRRAESDVASDDERSRRPSWAPPLILGEELAEVCLELGYLTLDDKWIGRLWAQFADPKRVGKHLRETISTHALPGIICRGFQLHAGGERQPASQILFEAQRTESGEWRFGPTILDFGYRSPRGHDWERLVRARATAKDADSIERLSQQIMAIDAEDRAAAQARSEQQSLRRRTVELATSRVLDFAGAPDGQMQMAGRLWGHCCICGKELTDPISLERGIGPDCLQDEIVAVRFAANLMRNAGEDVDAHRVAAQTMLPLEFVSAVLNEGAP